MCPICTALDKLENEEYVYTGILGPTLFMTVKKLLELQMNNNLAICLTLVMVLMESVQERFDKVLSNTEYQMVMHCYCIFNAHSMLDADNQSTHEKIKIKIIGMVEFLLNKEDLRATTSSHKTEEAAKQDDFFCLNNQKTEHN